MAPSLPFSAIARLRLCVLDALDEGCTTRGCLAPGLHAGCACWGDSPRQGRSHEAAVAGREGHHVLRHERLAQEAKRGPLTHRPRTAAAALAALAATRRVAELLPGPPCARRSSSRPPRRRRRTRLGGARPRAPVPARSPSVRQLRFESIPMPLGMIPGMAQSTEANSAASSPEAARAVARLPSTPRLYDHLDRGA